MPSKCWPTLQPAQLLIIATSHSPLCLSWETISLQFARLVSSPLPTLLITVSFTTCSRPPPCFLPSGLQSTSNHTADGKRRTRRETMSMMVAIIAIRGVSLTLYLSVPLPNSIITLHIMYLSIHLNHDTTSTSANQSFNNTSRVKSQKCISVSPLASRSLDFMSPCHLAWHRPYFSRLLRSIFTHNSLYFCESLNDDIYLEDPIDHDATESVEGNPPHEDCRSWMMVNYNPPPIINNIITTVIIITIPWPQVLPTCHSPPHSTSCLLLPIYPSVHYTESVGLLLSVVNGSLTFLLSLKLHTLAAKQPPENNNLREKQQQRNIQRGTGEDNTQLQRKWRERHCEFFVFLGISPHLPQPVEWTSLSWWWFTKGGQSQSFSSFFLFFSILYQQYSMTHFHTLAIKSISFCLSSFKNNKTTEEGVIGNSFHAGVEGERQEGEWEETTTEQQSALS